MAVAEAMAWRITQMVPASKFWIWSLLILVGKVDLLVEDGEGEVVRFISWLFELTITGYGFPLVVEFETAVKVLVKDKL